MGMPRIRTALYLDDSSAARNMIRPDTALAETAKAGDESIDPFFEVMTVGSGESDHLEHISGSGSEIVENPLQPVADPEGTAASTGRAEAKAAINGDVDSEAAVGTVKATIRMRSCGGRVHAGSPPEIRQLLGCLRVKERTGTGSQITARQTQRHAD